LQIDDIKLIRDHETGKSHGYGFITVSTMQVSPNLIEASVQQILPGLYHRVYPLVILKFGTVYEVFNGHKLFKQQQKIKP